MAVLGPVPLRPSGSGIVPAIRSCMRITFLLTTRCINYLARTRSFAKLNDESASISRPHSRMPEWSRSLFEFLSCVTSGTVSEKAFVRTEASFRSLLFTFFLFLFSRGVQNCAIGTTRARERTRGNVTTRACFRLVVVSRINLEA